MRVRSLVTFSAGAALGAGWMYLKDPDYGPDRRRELRREAWQMARTGAAGAARDLRAKGEDVVLAAVAGFEQGRVQQRPASGDTERRLRSVDS